VSAEPLYYDDMGRLEWAEAREKYLKNVGR